MRSVCRQIIVTCLGASSLLATSLAFANYFCSGTLDLADVAPDGTVIVNSSVSGLQYVELCQLGATAGREKFIPRHEPLK